MSVRTTPFSDENKKNELLTLSAGFGILALTQLAPIKRCLGQHYSSLPRRRIVRETGPEDLKGGCVNSRRPFLF